MELTRVGKTRNINNVVFVRIGSRSSLGSDCDDDSPGSLADFIDDETVPDSQDVVAEESFREATEFVPETPPCGQPSEDQDELFVRLANESKLKRSWETRRNQSVSCCSSSPLSSLVSTAIPPDGLGENVDRTSCTLHAVVKCLPSLARDVAFVKDELSRIEASFDSVLELLKKSGTDCVCRQQVQAKDGVGRTVLGSPLCLGEELPEGHIVDGSEGEDVALRPTKRVTRRLWRTLKDDESE